MKKTFSPPRFLGALGFLALNFLLALASAFPAHAAESGGGAAAYLREGLGSRALGMGNAGTASVDDASSAYWNPAGLLAMRGAGLASQTSVLGLERSWNFLNFGQNVGGHFGWGISWISFSAGSDLEYRTENRPEPERVFSASENTLFFSGALPLSQGMFLGANVKILTHQLDDSYATGVGADLGLWHAIAPELQWGLMLQDLYGNLPWSDAYSERLPASVRLGVCSRWFENRSLVLTADLGTEYDQAAKTVQNWKLRAGAEYCLPGNLFARAGVDNGRWTAGAGWQFPVSLITDFRIDYALAAEKLPGSGLSHLFSLVVDIGSNKLVEQTYHGEPR